jgi:hypothetical protein
VTSLWTTKAPITCEIGYQEKHFGSEDFYERVEAAQVGLAHIGHDVPFTSWMGPTIPDGLSKATYLTPDQLPERIESIRNHIKRMRDAGARSIAPYICPVLCCGNAETRMGWWYLLDHWEEFAHLGLGEKPDDDPREWNQGPLHSVPDDPTYLVYEPAVSVPAWRRFITTCVRMVAECGYDGVFLDVNSYHATKEIDRLAFVEYLTDRYSAEDRMALFGFTTASDVCFGEVSDSLLWFETLRYRACAMGQLFTELRDAGREHNPDFWVYPNNSPVNTIYGFYDRCTEGQQIQYIHPACKYIMFEDMEQPGRCGADRISDHIMQYRYALAHGARAAVLPYHANKPAPIALANAQCAANGGAMFVQPDYHRAEEVHFWTDWFDKHHDRHDNMTSVHDVGIVYFADEMFYDNSEHIEAVYRIRQALSDTHILYDFLVEEHFHDEALLSCGVVIVPELHHLSDDQIGVLERYVAAGGNLLFIGACGTHDERVAPRDVPPTQSIKGPNVAWYERLDDLVPNRGPELFDLNEDEANDTDSILGLPDRVSSQEEAQAARAIALISELERLAGRRLRVLNDEAPYSLRVSAFRSQDGKSIVAHLVNYNLPVVLKDHPDHPISVADISICLKDSSDYDSAQWWTPEGVDGDSLRLEDGCISVPEVGSYALIEIT